MSGKIYNIFFILLLVLAVVLVVVQRYKAEQMGMALQEIIHEHGVLEQYALSTFYANEFEGRAEISEICYPLLTDTSFVLYLPPGLCRACFSSLIFSFQDRNLPGSRITVVSGREDIDVKAECFARGIRYLVDNRPVAPLSDIILFRLYQGFLPVALSYNVGREQLLTLFLSDDDKLLQTLSGND